MFWTLTDVAFIQLFFVSARINFQINKAVNNPVWQSRRRANKIMSQAFDITAFELPQRRVEKEENGGARLNGFEVRSIMCQDMKPDKDYYETQRWI